MNTICEHHQGCGIYQYIYSPAVRGNLMLPRLPSLTFWDIMEEDHEDTVAYGDTLLVTTETKRVGIQTLRTDYQSKRIFCRNGDHRACWIRQVVYYLEGEQSPLPYDVNGTREW